MFCFIQFLVFGHILNLWATVLILHGFSYNKNLGIALKKKKYLKFLSNFYYFLNLPFNEPTVELQRFGP